MSSGRHTGRSRKRAALGCALLALVVSGHARLAAQSSGKPGLESWLSDAAAEVNLLISASDEELNQRGAQRLLRVYLDAYEPIENWYGVGARYETPALSALVTRGEQAFHAAMQAREATVLRARVRTLQNELSAIRQQVGRAGVPLVPDESQAVPALVPAGTISVEAARTREIRSIREALESAEREYAAGLTKGALTRIEDVYLQQVEPLEPRLPGPVTRRIESLIHLRLRPLVSREADVATVQPVFSALYAALNEADAALARGSSFWFGAGNAFVIIAREGLEAVLLMAAILAYLTGIGAARRERGRIYWGAAAGVLASFATWGMARTLLPVSGASREILEGVTALVAVVVLIYVSNWLFQKTYIHDWKNYLRERVGLAVTTGSALAMAGLAFAAVYREGFETVLFYQALLYDSSSSAVLAGFIPGMLLILAIGAAIIRAGVKLPLRKLFAVTNSILLYLAFVFTGKGVYNLQEAGLFAPHPLARVPDNDALRQLFGFHPMLETIIAQLVFVTLMAATYAYYRRQRNAAVSSLRASRDTVTAHEPISAQVSS